MNTTRGLSYVAVLIAAGLTLQCESQPESPVGHPPGYRPSFARHPIGNIKDSTALAGQPFAVAVSQYDDGNDGVVYVTRLDSK